MQEQKLTSWKDYWKKFDELITLLQKENKTEIINQFKDAQLYVNGLTDGWYEFLYAFEKVMSTNRPQMSESQIQIGEFLMKSLKQLLINR